MNRILLFILYSFIITCTAIAQENKYDISKPIYLTQTGINKVLCLKNGNTLLLHFDVEKPIVVKLFDSTHKLIASHEYVCSKLDITMLKMAAFKGLYDINGAAVLFIEQEHLSKRQLLRLCFSGKDGKLTEEKMIDQSEHISEHTGFCVMKNKNEDNYAILFSVDEPQFFKCNLHVTYYNALHEIIKDVPLEVDRKNYDYLAVVGAETQPDGICISLRLSKLKVNGTFTRLEGQPVYNNFLQVFFIPNNSAIAKSKTIDVAEDVLPYYTNSTYNPFAGTINLLLLSYREALYRFGLELRPTAVTSNLFFKLDENSMTPQFNWLNNQLATQYLKQQTDTGNFYQGLPIKTFTNNNGLSTMVSESYYRYNNIESHERSKLYETYLGNIAITQYDDDGKEIWGTVLPQSQYFKSYRHYYKPTELSKRWQQQNMFNDMPPQVYNRQFISFNTYSKGDDFYIVCNDDDNNFNKTIGQPTDTVYTFANTNTCYYKINKKKEVSKQYLFGTPLHKEYKCSFIEGSDYDEQRGVYATLIQYTKGESTSLRMAWGHLE